MYSNGVEIWSKEYSKTIIVSKDLIFLCWIPLRSLAALLNYLGARKARIKKHKTAMHSIHRAIGAFIKVSARL